MLGRETSQQTVEYHPSAALELYKVFRVRQNSSTSPPNAIHREGLLDGAYQGTFSDLACMIVRA